MQTLETLKQSLHIDVFPFRSLGVFLLVLSLFLSMSVLPRLEIRSFCAPKVADFWRHLQQLSGGMRQDYAHQNTSACFHDAYTCLHAHTHKGSYPHTQTHTHLQTKTYTHTHTPARTHRSHTHTSPLIVEGNNAYCIVSFIWLFCKRDL